MSRNDTAVWALTSRGAVLGRRLADGLNGDLFLPEPLAAQHGGGPFERLLDAVEDAFSAYRRHVFVAAAGIVVRAVAPLLRSKDLDPAVVVLDPEGRFAVSLLSGHLGGANELAREAARITGGTPVITTATDCAGVESWDLLAAGRGMAIANLEAVKALNAATLEGEPVTVWDPEDRLELRSRGGPEVILVESAEDLPGDRPAVRVTWREEPGAASSTCLVLHPRCLMAGVGCNRGTSAAEILELIRSVFDRHHLAPASLAALATIEAKRDEPGILEAARDLGVPVAFYSAGDLKGVRVPNPSETVKRHMGVESVCEAAALKRAGGKRLLVLKVRSRNATLAVALDGSSSSASAPEPPAV